MRRIILPLALFFIVLIGAVSIQIFNLDDALTRAIRPVPTPTDIVLRSAWIDVRDPCPESPEYKVMVAPGIGFQKAPEFGVNPGMVYHGSMVDILSEGEEWTQISHVGEKGYIQTPYIVEYDPAFDFQPATGQRFDDLCN